MFVMFSKVSKNNFDEYLFNKFIDFNSKIKEIAKIIILADFSINIKNNKVLVKVYKDITNIDSYEYIKKIYPKSRIIISEPYILINHNLLLLREDTKYINNYLTVYNSLPIKYTHEEYHFDIEILLYKITKKIEVIDVKKNIHKKHKNVYISSKDINTKNIVLTTIIVCYRLTHILSKTYLENMKYLNNIIVITDNTDLDTINFCKEYNINFISMNIIENGLLNKSRAINYGLRLVDYGNIVLLLDCDIILNKEIDLSKIKRNTIYTANRILFNNFDDYLSNIYYETEEPTDLGFFQLFYYEYQKYIDNNGGRFSESSVWSDKVFTTLFTYKEQILEKVFHIGDINRVWESETDKVFVGIATIKERTFILEKTIKSLINQVDYIGVYLNNYDNEIPDFLRNDKITIIESEINGNYGDAGKFYWVDNFKGYYFTCDDDIEYPSDYIKRTINRIEFYDRKCVIGFHGSRILDTFTTFYSDNSRKMLSFRFRRPKDEFAHILGTGTVGFHTSTISIRFSDFKIPNIADLWFAIKGQEQNIPFVVQSHDKGEMIQLEVDDSISKSSIQNNNTKLDTTPIQNSLVKSINWNLNKYKVNDKYKILMIGRFKNYKKGGIYKSNHIMYNVFEELGHIVYSIDSDDENYFIQDDIDICIIYPGDTTRPDFINAEKKMLEIQRRGIPCCINMSYNNEHSRTKDIHDRFITYNSSNKNSKIFMLTFSENVGLDPLLEKFKDYIITFPKTINLSKSVRIKKYEEREGIILGDVAKLDSQLIVNGNIQEWIDSIKNIMPDVNIYAYMQYGIKTDLKGLTLVPYTKDGFEEWLSSKRISACLTQKLSFEMLPTESQGYGIPVIYRNMPHSLNEWIGHSGICVNSPTEFALMIKWIYEDKNVWQKYSKLSILNFSKNDLNNLKLSLMSSLKKIIIRSNL